MYYIILNKSKIIRFPWGFIKLPWCYLSLFPNCFSFCNEVLTLQFSHFPCYSPLIPCSSTFIISGCSMLYTHIWRFVSRNCRWERTYGFCLFWVWVTSFNIIFSTYLQSLLFHFTLQLHRFHSVCVPHFIIHSSVEVHLGCFHLLWLGHQWTDEQVSVEEDVKSFGLMTTSVIAENYARFIFSFLRVVCSVSRVAAPVCISVSEWRLLFP